ncbi:CHASE2 domain-containing protein [Elusimicrobiota bacterium]
MSPNLDKAFLKERLHAAWLKLRARFSGMRRPSVTLLWKWSYWIAPLIILGGAVSLWIENPYVLTDLQNRVFDSYLHITPRDYDPEAPVRIIDIDEESLKRIGQWPWPRTKLSDMIRRLNAAGAGVIAFDVVYAEPDRTSPSRIASELPDTAEFRFFRDRLKTLPDHDRIFSQAIGEAGNVVLGFPFTGGANTVTPGTKTRIRFLTRQPAGAKSVSADALKEKTAGGASGENVWVDEVDPVDFLPDLYEGATKNLDPIEETAAGIGSFTSATDRDNIIRRVPILYRLRGKVYPSLAAEALRVALGARWYKAMAVVGDDAFSEYVDGLYQVVIRPGDRSMPPVKILTESAGTIRLFDTGYRPERFIPAWKIFEADFDASLVAGRILFVGTSAEGLKDLRGTPLNKHAAGVEVHAQIAEQVLLQKFLQRPAWAEKVEFFLFLLFGLLLIILQSRLGPGWSFILTAAAMIGAVAGSWHAYADKHLLIDPVFPSLVIFAIYLSATVFNFLRTASEKKQVRGAFSRYMSPALVEQLADDPSKLKLGGETRELTLMFSDIRGFTTISEQFDAHGLTQFINQYLTPMTEIVLDRGGTIDKYMGDCIMAFWNAPLEDKDHVINACRAALDMRRDLNELNEVWKGEAEAEGRKYIPIRAGIGLNTGPCCVGNMGSEQRFDYSVLGDDVNLASRLEGQSKAYGVDIVIGAKTNEYAQAMATLELDLIRVKGKTVPVRIYTMLGDEETAATEDFRKLAEKHAAMIEAYRGQKWDEADSLVAECRKFDVPLAKFYDLYAARVKACREDPPAPDWDGVFTATTK